MAFSLTDAQGGTGKFAELRAAANNSSAVRRTLKIALLISRTTVEVPKTIVAKDGTITIPAGVSPLGLVDQKGVVVKSKTTTDEIKSLGEGTVRSDVTEVERDLTVTIQESYRKQVMEVMLGQDLSAAKVSASGELVIDEESVPAGASYRLWALTYDVNKATGHDIVDARVFTNVTLSEAPGLTLAEKGAKDYDLSFKVLTDTKLGTHCRTIIGGLGFTELQQQLGWGAAAA